jgi:ubiquinone/menaquinone biosynthesis C-methylase UbiE
MIGRTHDAKIADLCSGPVSKVGQIYKWRHPHIIASDVLQPEYASRINQKLVTPVEYQDVRCLTYQNDSFDVVYCANALDHIEQIEDALKEIVRVCKVGGWIYLRHGKNQKRRYGGHHYWNATIDGFKRGEKIIPMDSFGKFTDGFEIIFTMKKGRDGKHNNTGEK